jgi:SAM-dependent methyltransferase
MTIHGIYGLISPLFRRRRLRQFERMARPGACTQILDVGGTESFWKESRFRGNVTLLNVGDERFGPTSLVKARVVGDGCAIAFPDRSFDIVFSNSVIEHVGTWERQVLFASECLRVGKAVWVQTPAREFFIEPHLIAPFIHWLPRSWRRRLIRWCTVRGWAERPGPADIEAFLDEVRLISHGEMARLFPGCRILRERFLGLSKSYVAVRQAGEAPPA